MIICPECETEYEKEAKYCFKCRIPFSDDIPEIISKYLKRNPSLNSLNKPSGINTDSKPPLNRNTSSGGIKSSSQISSGTPGSSQSPAQVSNISTTTLGANINSSNNVSSPINSHSSPNTSMTGSGGNSSIGTNGVSSGNLASRPRLASSPTPPTHPLPPTPNRNSVPVAINNSTIVSTKPPITSGGGSGNPNISPSSKDNVNINNVNRTTSPITAGGNLSSDFQPIPISSPHVTHDTQPYQPLKRPISTRIPPPPPTQKLAKAIWDCVPEQLGDLEFRKGDTIVVISKDTDGSGWWRGKIQGSTVEGLFPGNYCIENE